MPSIRVRGRYDEYKELQDPGLGLLLSALKKRIDLDALIPDPAARERLVFASGGNLRELLLLAHEATLETGSGPITLAMVERVVQRHLHRKRDTVDANAWWDTLVGIGRGKRLSEDPKCQAVLFHRLAFHYSEESGGGWYDIHPLLSLCPEVQKARGPLA
jgi:hypothetical protein